MELNDIDRWCIDQEYIGIENSVERNIKIFHDYRQTHSYDEYVQLVKDEHAAIEDVRPIAMVQDYLNSSTQVYHDGISIGEISMEDDKLQFTSYEGIGDNEYPVIYNVAMASMSQEEVVELYQNFDKYVIDGEYLLDKSRKNTIDDLYLRMIENCYELPKELQRSTVLDT